MSDNFITISSAKEVEKPIELKNKVIDWLQSNDYIEKELSYCVMSMKKKGYKPGKNHISAIGGDENILRLQVCGLETKTEREIFNAGTFTAMTKMECTNCNKNRFESITPQDFFTDNCTKEQMELFNSVFPVFDKWTRHEKAMITCPHCSVESNIDEYNWDNSISFSNLGFIFWNWPNLTNNFMDELRSIIGTDIKRINGHI